MYGVVGGEKLGTEPLVWCCLMEVKKSFWKWLALSSHKTHGSLAWSYTLRSDCHLPARLPSTVPLRNRVLAVPRLTSRQETSIETDGFSLKKLPLLYLGHDRESALEIQFGHFAQDHIVHDAETSG